MSGKCGSTDFMDIRGRCLTNCEASICSDRYSDRKCKCYPNLSIIQDEGGDTNSIQFCAFESDDGFIYPCDPGCCGAGCPGQCEGVAPRPPVATYASTDATPKSKKTNNIFMYWAMMTLFFLLLSVL